MRRGEIRRARNWNYIGHEATGNRPCLIISPDWFNSNGHAIIAPLTTPGPNHENWWEIHIASTDSICLVPDVRTVPLTALGPSVIGRATQYELEGMAFALSRLTGGSEDTPDPYCNRGDVWEADLSDMQAGSNPTTAALLVVHYNPVNLMAITLFVTDRPRNSSPIVFAFGSPTGLIGRSALLTQVRAISAQPRLVSLVCTVPQADIREISDKFMAFIGS